ncbi:MAG: flagellar biosynthesis protein FlhF [Lachnospiraceae bacterium]|nr:flagellar biosynthesis protein FlhF [Candidatus Merdinaster equi]
MIIKKYLANTQAEAEDAARRELGPGFAIMEVKSVKHKGLARLFKAPMKEVTVGIEDDGERLSSAIKDIAKVVEDGGKTIDVKTSGEGEEFLKQLKAHSEKDNAQTMPANTKADRAFVDESLEDIDAKISSLKNMLQDTLGVKNENKDSSASANNSGYGAKENTSHNKSDDNKTNEGQSFVKLLYNTMIENEVHEKYANAIIEDLEKDIDLSKDIPIDHLLANVYQKMILKFGKPEGVTVSDKGPKIVFFVGPTGVGKTTTIAKLASKFQLVEKKKVVLLTTDTYRIAATEQLKTYANILNVPFRIIYHPDEMTIALNEYGDADYILIDTAGHSHQNADQRETMQKFIDCVDDKFDKEVFLVVSATTKYKDLISISDTYKEMTNYKLIFTKLDETLMFGNLFNLRLHTGASMSYVTCGQNVPNDIEPFNPQATVKMLLGGRNK